MEYSWSEQEDVQRLVELSEDMYRDRRERIEQIQWERQDPRLPDARPDWRNESSRLSPLRPLDSNDSGYERDRSRRHNGEYEEVIREREVVYEDGSRRRYRIN